MATFRARVGGYLVDMVIFAAIAMLVVVFAGFLLLWWTDWAEQDATDPQFYTFLAIIGIGAPLIWSVMNVLLMVWRGQTAGQYVAGIRLVRENGGALSPRHAIAWWLCLNPLLFSWPMAIVAGGPLVAVAALVVGSWAVILFALVAMLCIAAPIVAFISGLLDAQNRALHDRVAGTIALPAE